MLDLFRNRWGSKDMGIEVGCLMLIDERIKIFHISFTHDLPLFSYRSGRNKYFIQQHLKSTRRYINITKMLMLTNRKDYKKFYQWKILNRKKFDLVHSRLYYELINDFQGC